MTIPVFQVDAFTHSIFSGNPAAICPIPSWLPEDIMQRVAMENNLAETAFVVPEGEDYHIRWFTPTVEVALCGHATLAAAFVFFEHLGYQRPLIRFNSKSGWLTVERNPDGRYTLDFPADPPAIHPDPVPGLLEGLGVSPRDIWRGKFDFMVELENEEAVAALRPDFRSLSGIKSRGILVTARGKEADFVSRCFFPQSGIDEDPVTGSAHCLLTPYWTQKTGKQHFKAIQWSARKGWLDCQLAGDRVRMSGSATLFLKGEIYLP
ncbi:MAG: PhzF family phenazine biosynthesis protein [Chitinophagaceae bacterium]|jgi:PhzF family phenazine biosynthesis protein|nr:PhzF family phenazine biosynthesis protein [Chitinophagaceae bacterium]